MNWQLPLMLGQTTDELRKRTQAGSLDGTTVPESSLVREGTSNPFVAEYWFPEQASSFAKEVDDLYMLTFWISLVFFVAIVGVMVYFCIKYRRKGDVIDPQPSTSHNTAIEIIWSVLPSLLLVWIFYIGADSWFKMRVAKDNAEEIQVTAKQFGWVFTYPDGDQSSELHLVVDKPATLVLQSEDVLHSFFVPAFRQKMDIVPGRYTYAYIEPTLPGQYRLSCNEYCGTGHSKMKTMAEVHKSDADRKANTVWITTDHHPWENGKRTYQIQCSGCHKIDGSKATGPALNLIWGTEEKIIGSDPVKVDAEYVKESIWEPNTKIVKGYSPKMNSFQGILDQGDITDVVAFLKYLKDKTDFESANADATEEDFKKAFPDYFKKVTGDEAETAPETTPTETPTETPATPALEEANN